MQEDFLSELQYAGFTARIKRLSDQLLYSARKVYENLEMDIEPNWHLIFLILKREKALTVTEIASQLGFSHPGVIKIVKKMRNSGYLQSIPDENDSRKQLIQLTTKGTAALPALEQKWNEIQQTIQGFTSPTLLKELSLIEGKLAKQNLYERFVEHNQKTK